MYRMPRFMAVAVYTPGMSFLWYWPKGGWDFSAWKSAHPWEPIKSEQSGKHELVRLVAQGASAADWEKAREKWRAVSDAVLGEIADKKPSKVTWEWLGEELLREKSPSFTMRRL